MNPRPPDSPPWLRFAPPWLAAAVDLGRLRRPTDQRPAPPPPEWAPRAIADYQGGDSAAVVAATLSAERGERIGAETVRRVLRAQGVMRTTAQAARLNPRAGEHLIGSGKPADEMTDRTASTYQSRWRQYARWCSEHRIEPYGIDTATLERFALDLIDAGRPVGAVTGMLVAVRHMHTEAGLPVPGAVARLRQRAVERGRANAELWKDAA